MLKFYSNKIMLCGVGGKHPLDLNKTSPYYLIFKISTIIHLIKHYFSRKDQRDFILNKHPVKSTFLQS